MYDESAWHWPIKAYSDHIELAESVNVEQLQKLEKYQKTRQVRAVAVLFCTVKKFGTPW